MNILLDGLDAIIFPLLILFVDKLEFIQSQKTKDDNEIAKEYEKRISLLEEALSSTKKKLDEKTNQFLEQVCLSFLFRND